MEIDGANVNVAFERCFQWGVILILSFGRVACL